MREYVETVVIGGGQAGLAVGHELAARHKSFVILDAHERVGDAWRKRWDSLLLFTPARYAALPGMKSRGWGRILCITSIAAKQPVDNLILSNSLRAAVTGLAKTLARETAKDGVTVNTILPGYTETDRVVELLEGSADPAAARSALESEVPMGRIAQPEEFAGLAAFLVSERAGYITGGSFSVDGGWIRSLF